MLTSDEIKQILQKRIEEKEKEVRPDLFNQMYVQLVIAELEALYSIFSRY
jgi:GTP-sensing pleiotropic transcriptional regulator CodY